MFRHFDDFKNVFCKYKLAILIKKSCSFHSFHITYYNDILTIVLTINLIVTSIPLYFSFFNSGKKKVYTHLVEVQRAEEPVIKKFKF